MCVCEEADLSTWKGRTTGRIRYNSSRQLYHERLAVRDPVVSDQLNHPRLFLGVQLFTRRQQSTITNNQHTKCLPTGHTLTASPATSRQTAPHTAPSPAGWQSTNSHRTPAPAQAPQHSVVLATHGRTRNHRRAQTSSTFHRLVTSAMLLHSPLSVVPLLPYNSGSYHRRVPTPACVQ